LPSITLVGGRRDHGRFTRSSSSRSRGDFIRTARAKVSTNVASSSSTDAGNALIPVVTMMETAFGFLLGGSIVVRSVHWPGSAAGSSAVDYARLSGIQALVCCFRRFIRSTDRRRVYASQSRIRSGNDDETTRRSTPCPARALVADEHVRPPWSEFWRKFKRRRWRWSRRVRDPVVSSLAAPGSCVRRGEFFDSTS